ncbi:hypothetical protein [Yoonia sp. R2-816]|uniref:hypothetical protein n=1 Tax=Yoonia sp. R2-816 TaxID=3342638 RepID=UPI00372990E9
MIGSPEDGTKRRFASYHFEAKQRFFMSAPETNVETQKKRHRGPLIGILAAVLLVAAVFVAFLAWTADDVDTTVQDGGASAVSGN